jgi:hypothetical protein
MRSVEIYSNLQLEQNGQTILLIANGTDFIIELPNQKIFKDIKQLSFGGGSIYSYAFDVHKSANLAGIKIIIKISGKTILTLGNTSFYLFKKILIQIANILYG